MSRRCRDVRPEERTHRPSLAAGGSALALAFVACTLFADIVVPSSVNGAGPADAVAASSAGVLALADPVAGVPPVVDPPVVDLPVVDLPVVDLPVVDGPVVDGPTALRLPRPLDTGPFEAALEKLPAARLAALEAIVADADIATLRDRLAAGVLSVRELVLLYVSRIRRLDGALAAVAELDPEALREAERLDARHAAGHDTGRLHGIPLLLKDNIATGDRLHTTAGAAALAAHVARRDASVVARLRAAGALILGKTNLSEWAHFMSSAAPSGYSALGGQVHNPYGEALEVLGSSSGSAVAATARFAAATLGTETTGSIIAPAAANGVAGMRPTPGLVATDLIVPITAALDGAGPIARSVRDLAELLSVMAVTDGSGPHAAPATERPGRDFAAGLDATTLAGLRVGVPDIALPAAGDTASAVLERVVRVLERSGARVVPVGIPASSVATLADHHLELLAGSMRDDVARYLAAAGAPLDSLADVIRFNEDDPETRAPFGQDLLIMARDSRMTAEAHAALAARLRAVALGAMTRGVARAHADVLLSLDNAFSLLYALGGTPAVTVPAGLDAAGQPHGATFVGVRPGTDADVLGVAHAFERAARLRVEPPLPP